MEPVESKRYSTDAGTADITATSVASPAKSYANVAAMLAANAGSVFEAFGERGIDKYLRADLSVGINGSNGHTCSESWHLVYTTDYDGVQGVEVRPLADVTWTCGANAITAGRNSHKFPSAVTVTPKGEGEAMTGKAPVAQANEPAHVSVFDVGPAIGILRCMSKGPSATGIAPMRMRWR